MITIITIIIRSGQKIPQVDSIKIQTPGENFFGSEPGKSESVDSGRKPQCIEAI